MTVPIKVLLLSVAFAVSAAALQGRAAAQDTVRIGSWNIANLHAVENQKPEGRDFAKARNTANYDQLKQVAAGIAFDVVALQEIHSIAAAQRVFPDGEWQICFENGRKAADQNRPVGERTAIYTALAVRKGRFDTVNCFEVPELAVGHKEPDGVTRLVRGGTGAVVKKGTAALTVLSVHLKSSCSTQPVDSAIDDCVTLHKQIPILNKWIDDTFANSPALVVAGDFNRRLGGEGEKFWEGINDQVPAALDLFRVPFGDDSDGGRVCVDRPIQIDHLVFPKEVFAGAPQIPRYTQGSFRRLPIPGATKDEREVLSDHCPIWGDFKWPS
jgi:endonuclease/exonuclease/phosphatase family metal-dependent hydrolase